MGRVGDGWLVSSATPDEVREGRDIVFDTANQCQREIEYDHIGVLMGFYIADDYEQAATNAHQVVTRHRPDASFTEYTALGTTEQVAELIQRYIDAGGSKFAVRPLCAGDESMEQLEMIYQVFQSLIH